jgi:hypothetical protein
VRLGRRPCRSTRALELERAPLGAADIVGVRPELQREVERDSLHRDRERKDRQRLT